MAADEGLMTVGDLAKRTGVTIRTIQYYDQIGLLSPSQTNSARQRLYSAQEEQELRRILVLKYLGLSLSDIAQEKITSAQDFAAVIAQSQDKLSHELLGSLQRFTALGALAKQCNQTDDVDWTQAAHTIQQMQAGMKQFWDALAEEEPSDSDQRKFTDDEVLAWHALMGEVVEALRQGYEPTDEYGKELGARFMSLGGDKRACQGLGRMQEQGAALQSLGKGGRQFYQKLQDKAIAFLREAASSIDQP